LVAAMQQTLMGSCYKMTDDEVYISFLPLAHVLALTAEGTMIFNGVTIGYGSARSLTDSMVRNCKGDLTELKPTLMAGVPTVFDRVKKGAREKIDKSGGLTKSLFNFAYNLKKKAIANNEDTPFWNSIIFNKFREQLGGRMRMMLSGGAPLSHDTHEFLRVCFGCFVVQGYGLTETCGGGTLQNVMDPGYCRIGAPLPGMHIKLVDVEEMGYLSSNNPPKGEVWLNGPNVAMRGYYKNPKKSAEDFVEGDWFRTGDVGSWTPDGALEIIDRVKNLVKLSHGEYIALENLESKFKASAYIDLICVYADSSEPFPVALVVPVRTKLIEWAEANKIEDAHNFEGLCQNKKAKDLILADLLTIGKAQKMKSFELPKDILLCPEEWTPQNGLLTAAMKLKRQPITEAFKKEISELYKANRTD